MNDCTQAIELLGEHKAEAVLADKGYDSDAIVEHVEAMGAKAESRPNATARFNASMTKISTNNEIESNVVSANSSLFEDSPRATKNQKPPSTPWSL